MFDFVTGVNDTAMRSVYCAGHIQNIDLVLAQLYKMTYGEYEVSSLGRTNSSRQMCVLFVLYWEHSLLPIPLSHSENKMSRLLTNCYLDINCGYTFAFLIAKGRIDVEFYNFLKICNQLTNLENCILNSLYVTGSFSTNSA